MLKYYYKKIIGVGAGIVAFLVVLGLIIERAFSSRIVYKEPACIVAERERMIAKYHAQPVTFATADGERIAGLLIARPHATRMFIICHGYKSYKERRSAFADLFPSDTLLFIDLRGHGESSGKRASLGLHEYQDCVAAYTYMREHVSAQLPLFGLGISLGGSALLRAAAAGAAFHGIIADSSPSEFKKMIQAILWRRHYVPHLVGKLALMWYQLRMGYNLADAGCDVYARHITCPVLIVHDRDDKVVSHDHALALYATLGTARKQLITVTGTRHGRMVDFDPQLYKTYIERFIEHD